MKGRIGIIAPVYKTEKYIAECIESILAQTYTNFRLILVDDGSPDNAGTICDEYAEKDSRITVIHQENAGVTRARAAGVEAAEDCEWITFVDSDDTITEDALNRLYRATEHNCDIIIAKTDQSAFTCNAFDINKYRELLILEKISCEPWGKLFRRVLFDNNTFCIPREIVVGEDLLMNIRIAFKCNKKVNVIDKIYNYRIYNESTYNSFVTTHKYEALFYQHKLASIPVKYKEQYLYHTIEPRLLKFRLLWGYKVFVGNMKQNVFYSELQKDIKKLKYKMPVIDYVIFNYTNPIIRFFAVNLKIAINYISK